jgi:hypothetical protein
MSQGRTRPAATDTGAQEILRLGQVSVEQAGFLLGLNVKRIRENSFAFVLTLGSRANVFLGTLSLPQALQQDHPS